MLCVKWHPTQPAALYSGTAKGTVLGWDVPARRAAVRMQVENLGAAPTLVWALAVLR